MINGRKGVAVVVTLLFLFTGDSISHAQTTLGTKTQIVMLGTGTPLPDPDRAGPSTAIVVDGSAYIVDIGAGIVRRAAAARDRGIKALEPTNLKIAFLTHLHADHTLGFPDLILTPWIMGRTDPLQVYGPPGTRAMANYILEAYAVDIKTRTEGLEHSNGTGYKVVVHEIMPGIVYKDANVTVRAFMERHGSMDAYGYRFETADRTIVITGDTSPTKEVVENCHACDVLIYEAYTLASFEKVSSEWKRYRQEFHSSSKELGEIANGAKPGLLILYHRGNAGCDQLRTQDCRDAGSEEQLLKEVRDFYKGKVVAAHDLDVY